VEVWINEAQTASDWATFSSRFRETIEGGPEHLLICGDYRCLTVLTPAVSDTLLDTYNVANAKLERAALLVPHRTPLLRAQVEKLIRSAQNANRRLCSDEADVRAWLASRLDAEERTRLEQFLASSEKS
jgi:hypothetical protein